MFYLFHFDLIMFLSKFLYFLVRASVSSNLPPTETYDQCFAKQHNRYTDEREDDYHSLS